MAQQIAAKRVGVSPPGTDGIWIFVFLDMVMFLLLFLTYVTEKHRIPDVFSASQYQLNESIGLVNTLILLTSSWAVAGAVVGCRRRLPIHTDRYLCAAIILGLMFCVAKGWEYWTKIELGVTPITNVFFSFYYVITGIHFLHVLAGLVVMAILLHKRRSAFGSDHYQKSLENLGTFWHFVDLVWLFIFPLLYLTGLSR
ncbi:cytochrome c oxidase subunit 3 [Spongiibacter taiwanensis]|uniref:cytochrome c oxidase subunit 3 n=1 Tax=Spongiibacter taiwanensis TaxID=1748242 RepID=UPI002035E40F|nr:cytochrome c oxidase subunit 3 [Spongiibacter taiwanensis]USA42558.1 cytochrome c oxidase subunit 3 [Spongiibacter taiwanensis]